ncbi:MAG: helix-turn-helix transcriptional regulator [Gemmatimonadota bacterium]
MATENTHEGTPDVGRIYNRLRVLRAERGLSRLDLANAVGVNHQTIGYLERGDYSPSLELAFRLSSYFKLPIEAIFALQPFPPLSTAIYRPSAVESDQGVDNP